MAQIGQQVVEPVFVLAALLQLPDAVLASRAAGAFWQAMFLLCREHWEVAELLEQQIVLGEPLREAVHSLVVGLQHVEDLTFNLDDLNLAL